MIVLIDKIKNHIFIFSIICSLCIQAQINNTFTLENCLKLALKNNLTIKNIEIQKQISTYQLKSKKSELLPYVSGIINNGYSWGRSIDPNTNSFTTTKFSSYNGGVSANILLFSGFSKLKNIKSFKYELEINKTEIQKIKNSITIDVAFKYITILYLKEIIKANKEQIKFSEKQVEIAQLKFNNGYISESDLYKIKSQKANEELTLTNNHNLLESNLLDLKLLLQLPLNKNIDLVEYNDSFFETSWLDENKYDLLNKAVKINPTYKISLLQTQKAKNDIGISRASFFPSLSLGSSINSIYSDNIDFRFKDQIDNNLSYGINFSLTIPLFNQFQNKYAVKQSKAFFHKSKVQQRLEKNSVSKIILNAINDAKSAKKKYETSKQAYKYGMKSYEADLLKYKLGQINVNELNTTKNNYINSQSDLIQAKYEFMYSNAVVLFYMGEKFKF